MADVRSSPRWLLSLILMSLLAAPAVSRAALERVGPTTSGNGYPLWYQDATGITLEFCSPTNDEELAGGWCLLLPGDTTVPESFPDAFADEHFYWAADASGTWTLGGASGDAILVLGLEAAFAIDVAPGGQIVFGRLRIRIDDLPVSGTYTVYTPYGKYVFPDQVAGARLFFTEDIGLSCNQGTFDCALQSSVGPFLLPSSTPGGAELPPVTGPVPGKLYLADPARVGPVTGSPLPDYVLPNGETRNPNLFRVEGPGGVTMLETTDFTMVGRLFTGNVPGRIAVDRASYTRSASTQRIDAFATAFPSRDVRLPGTPILDPVAPALALYPAPCGGTVGANGDVLPPFTAPAGVSSVSMANSGSAYWAQTSPDVLSTGVCVAHVNARDVNGVIAPVYLPAVLGDQVFVTEATYDPDNARLRVSAFSSDGVTRPALTLGAFGDVPSTLFDESGFVEIATTAPPAKVRVLSTEHGSDERQVTVVASSGAANEQPVAASDAAATLSGQPVVIAVLANDSDPDANPLRVASATQPASGQIAILNGETIQYTPNASFVGTDAFTYTITDDRGGFSSASVVVTVDAAPNEAPVANPDAAITGFETPITVSVLANDTDANGDPLAITALDQPLAGLATHDGVRVTYAPPLGFSGTVSFGYTVSDSRGGSTVGLVTIVVRPAETLTITLAQFRNPSEWRVAGTSTVEGATITIHSGSTLDGPVIGTAVVAGGTWTFRSSTTGVPSSTRISVESTGGASRLAQAVTIR